MRHFGAAFLILLLFSPALAQEPPLKPTQGPPATSKLVRLESGRVIRVYSVQRMTFGDKSHPPSLLIRYETLLQPKDSEALRAEVEEVWELLRPYSDANGDTYAIVMANEPIRGLITYTKSFTYGFIKTDGLWRMREPKKY